MAISKIDSDGITAGGITADSLDIGQIGGRRNLIINGAMQVAQRGTQVTGYTTTAYNTVDRFRFTLGSLGTWTVDQSTDAPANFSNSFKLTCTTADASPAAGDQAYVEHIIEAQDLQQLGVGTSSAKQLTLSFWVKSNKTGGASIGLLQEDASYRLESNTYTITTADTWEYKTVSITADTGGTINNDNGAGLLVQFWVNSGSTYTGGAVQTWAAIVNANRNPSNLGVGGATSDYFAITGVQLEVGSVATPFEHRSYGEELAACQRYFCKLNSIDPYTAVAAGVARSATTCSVVVNYPKTMRAQPDFNYSGSYTIVAAANGVALSAEGVAYMGESSMLWQPVGLSGAAEGRGVCIHGNNDPNSYLEFDAEL